MSRAILSEVYLLILSEVYLFCTFFPELPAAYAECIIKSASLITRLSEIRYNFFAFNVGIKEGSSFKRF